MREYFFTEAAKAEKENSFYGTTFKFGNLRDSFLDGVRSLHAIVLENQTHHFRSRNLRTSKWITTNSVDCFFLQVMRGAAERSSVHVWPLKDIECAGISSWLRGGAVDFPGAVCEAYHQGALYNFDRPW
jgi:hypothetical protein